MFKNKRQGVELTMNVLIIAVISLLVLMLLAFLLIKGFGNWNTGTECTGQGGKCLDTKTCSAEYPVRAIYTCPKNTICCVNMGGLGDEAPKAQGP